MRVINANVPDPFRGSFAVAKHVKKRSFDFYRTHPNNSYHHKLGAFRRRRPMTEVPALLLRQSLDSNKPIDPRDATYIDDNCDVRTQRTGCLRKLYQRSCG